MLKMPALIREWKSVSSCLGFLWSGVLLTVYIGRSEELDQVAQIRVCMVLMGYICLLYDYTTNMNTNPDTTLLQFFDALRAPVLKIHRFAAALALR